MGGVSPKLKVIIKGEVKESQLSKLFDIIPGLEYCDLRMEQGEWGPKGRFKFSNCFQIVLKLFKFKRLLTF